MERFLLIGHAYLPFLECAGDTYMVDQYPANPKRAVTFYNRPASWQSVVGLAVHSHLRAADALGQHFQRRSKPFATRAEMDAAKREASVWSQSTYLPTFLE